MVDPRDALIDRLYEALRLADSHTKELRDAWQRGAINECDGKGGTRSNRNVDVEVACREALRAVDEYRAGLVRVNVSEPLAAGGYMEGTHWIKDNDQ